MRKTKTKKKKKRKRKKETRRLRLSLDTCKISDLDSLALQVVKLLPITLSPINNRRRLRHTIPSITRQTIPRGIHLILGHPHQDTTRSVTQQTILTVIQLILGRLHQVTIRTKSLMVLQRPIYNVLQLRTLAIHHTIVIRRRCTPGLMEGLANRLDLGFRRFLTMRPFSSTALGRDLLQGDMARLRDMVNLSHMVAHYKIHVVSVDRPQPNLGSLETPHSARRSYQLPKTKCKA
jgi:hypothetical protein